MSYRTATPQAIEPAPVPQAVQPFLSRMAVLALLVVVYNDVLGGVVRFIALKAGAPQLAYLPLLMATAVTLAYMGYHAVRLELNRGLSFLLYVFTAYAAYTLIRGASAGQVAFAVYTWMPFFLAAIVMVQGRAEAFTRHLWVWWGLAVLGVILNKFVAMPWTGTSYEVFGREVQAAVEWRTYGIDRLAGFSRASYAAANQIAIFSMLLLALRTNYFVKTAVWCVSVIAIAFTTSKTPLLTMFAAPLCLMGYGILSRNGSPTGSMAPVHFTRWAVIVLIAIVVALPVMPSASDNLSDTFQLFGFINVASIIDRMSWMWPGAWDLMRLNNDTLTWVLGRGIGTIGVGQQIAEPDYYNSADNLFLFLYVTFGVGSALWGYFMLAGQKRLYRASPQAFVQHFMMITTVLMLGIMTNVIESVIPCLLMGFIAGRYFTVSKSAIPGQP